MNLESRLSGVAAFLRADKLELLSTDDDKEPALNPLETEGDRADGEEIIETVFLIPLLPLLPNIVEETLLEEEEEVADDAGLTKGFLTISRLPTSDAVDVFRLRPTGDTGTDFLVSETLALVEVLVTGEGTELLLASGRDRLTVSEPEVAVFFPATEPALLCRLSGKPPVLFRLAAGTPFELFNDALTVGFITDEVESKPALDSNLFLTGTVAAETFKADATLGFTAFETFFPLSDEPAEA